MIPLDSPLTWETVYLLAWYDDLGRAYLTTWDGDLPIVGVVVVGCTPGRMPLWKSSVPKGAELHPMPDGLTHQQRIEHATKMGGFYALGWRVPVERDLV